MRSWDQDDPHELLGAHVLLPGARPRRARPLQRPALRARSEPPVMLLRPRAGPQLCRRRGDSLRKGRARLRSASVERPHGGELRGAGRGVVGNGAHSGARGRREAACAGTRA